MARFRHPLKLGSFSKEELNALIDRFKSQKRVAEYLGVGQMTVSRAMKSLGIKYDGKAEANRNVNKRQDQSRKMLEKYAKGEITPFWEGKTVPLEIIEKRISKLRGKPSWNAGKIKSLDFKCEVCGCNFTATRETRKLCGRKCTAEYMRSLYSDGRFLGEKNPNFGNDKVKEAWKNGAFSDRKLPRHGRGIGGRYKGVWMRSSWEIEFATALDLAGIHWKYEPKRFKLSNGKTYTPDFYISEKRLWVEIKGYWYGESKEKFELFVKDYPDENIIVISEKPLWHSILNG